MAKTIEIPDAAYEELEERARAAGLSVEAYALRELQLMQGKLTIGEVWERIKDLPPVVSSETAAEMIRAGREERERHLDEVISRRR